MKISKDKADSYLKRKVSALRHVLESGFGLRSSPDRVCRERNRTELDKGRI